MRVIAGQYRHRRLLAPAGRALRPSSDRLRESLFNILGERIEAAVFVDAFAGTGAVGIEALSRGATAVVWIESAPMALRTLRANLSELGIAGADVLALPVERALGPLARLPAIARRGGCDFFFFDPPYADTRAGERLLAQLERRPELIGAGSTIIVESRRGTSWPESCGRLARTRLHTVGDSQLTFFTPT